MVFVVDQNVIELHLDKLVGINKYKTVSAADYHNIFLRDLVNHSRGFSLFTANYKEFGMSLP